jgi:hypothetical protein
MDGHTLIKAVIRDLYHSMGQLSDAFPHKEFTLDGRLVGDIGEVLAELYYDVELYHTIVAYHDGETSDGRKVQVKATFKDSLTYGHIPDFYLGLKIFPDGNFEEVFNGPGYLIQREFQHRKGIGKKLLGFPIKRLKTLSERVTVGDRIPKRVILPE